MTTAPHLLVIGSGLAGAAAALLAAQRGARVTVITGRPGAAARFSGRLDLYGAAEPPAQRPWTGYGPPRPHLPPTDALTHPEPRLAALLARRPHHPLRGLSAETTSVECAALLRLVAPDDLLLLLPAPAVLPTDAGTAALADGVAATAAPLPDPDAPRAWIGLACADAYPADAAAALFAALTHLPPNALLPAELPWPPAHTPAHPALPVGLLDTGPDTPQGRAFIDALKKLLPTLPRDAGLLLPPILGRSFEVAARWIDTLQSALDRPVRERLAVEQPVFGLRLWTHLQRTLQHAPGVTLLRGPAARLDLTRDAGRVTALRAHLPDATHHLTDLRAVLLAPGRFDTQALRAEPPLREALLDLPLYLDGAPLDAQDLDPTELLGARPGAEHPLFTLGLGVDPQGRPLDEAYAPAALNLYAAGRVLAGTHAALDGTAHAVDLLSAARAVRAALT